MRKEADATAHLVVIFDRTSQTAHADFLVCRILFLLRLTGRLSIIVLPFQCDLLLLFYAHGLQASEAKLNPKFDLRDVGNVEEARSPRTRSSRRDQDMSYSSKPSLTADRRLWTSRGLDSIKAESITASLQHR